MAMCDMQDMGGGRGPGITLIIVGGKPPMPPGHSLTGGAHDMGPSMDMAGDDSQDMAPPKDAMPPKRPMMNTKNLSTKREVMRPRGL